MDGHLYFKVLIALLKKIWFCSCFASFFLKKNENTSCQFSQKSGESKINQQFQATEYA